MLAQPTNAVTAPITTPHSVQPVPSEQSPFSLAHSPVRPVPLDPSLDVLQLSQHLVRPLEAQPHSLLRSLVLQLSQDVMDVLGRALGQLLVILLGLLLLLLWRSRGPGGKGRRGASSW
jgi:hypothetical protein